MTVPKADIETGVPMEEFLSLRTWCENVFESNRWVITYRNYRTIGMTDTLMVVIYDEKLLSEKNAMWGIMSWPKWEITRYS